MYNFEAQFNSAIEGGDISTANEILNKELANILVNNKQDFVDMLTESGVSASNDMTDMELIELYCNNAPKNNKLLLGSAILINYHNKKSGFDGESEIDDDLVKKSYFTMKSCFVEQPNEEYSYIAPAVVAALIPAAAKVVGKGLDVAKERKTSKDKLQQEALIRQEQERRRREQERIRQQEEREKRRTNLLIFGGIGVLGLVFIGFIVMRKR
jgi:hypothetical protein